MIDIHTHILPHIDDGAKDTETAKAMLQAELKQGVNTVVFTPHYYSRSNNPTRFLLQRKEAFEHMKPHLPDGLTYRLGAEVHFTGHGITNYEELSKLAIEGTKYIIFELPFAVRWSDGLLDEIYEFTSETGYTPIIAHIERYKDVLDRPALVTEFLEMGCLLQVNAQAFFNKMTKNFAFALLKHGYVHCIGTDAHDMQMRTPELLEAKELIKNAGYAEEWERAQAIMGHILADEKVSVPVDGPIKKFLGKYF